MRNKDTDMLIEMMLDMFDNTIHYYDTEVRDKNTDNQESINFIVGLSEKFREGVLELYDLWNESENIKLN